VGSVSEKLVLIVDDEENYQIILSRMLSKYKVITAGDAYEALIKLGSVNEVDLILLDIDMPGMNGIELAGKIKTDFPDIKAPIIFVSARSDLESYVEGFEIGADDYITKPFEREQVMKIVDDKLNPIY
jgi:DNA-binding response OmpR family regulator